MSYIRNSIKKWKLNGQLFPSRTTLIDHLRLEHGLDWPFELMTYDELLDIHDDDHNGVLNDYKQT